MDLIIKFHHLKIRTNVLKGDNMPIDHTQDDIQYVKMYILLPLILTAFDRDKKIMEKYLKTPGPYVGFIDTAMDKVTLDLKEVRRKFRLLGLKVYEETRTELGIEAKYLCRGYHHSSMLLWSFVAAECSVLMEKYMGADINKRFDPTVPGSERDYDLPEDKAKTT